MEDENVVQTNLFTLFAISDVIVIDGYIIESIEPKHDTDRVYRLEHSEENYWYFSDQVVAVSMGCCTAVEEYGHNKVNIELAVTRPLTAADIPVSNL